jgi:arylsulfatase A-like enzyme
MCVALVLALGLVSCSRQPPASVKLTELSAIAASSVRPTPADFSPAESWAAYATGATGPEMALIKPQGRIRMTGRSLFPLFLELQTAPLRPTGVKLRWAGRYLHTITVPRAPTTHQIMIPPRLLDEPSRGLTLQCTGEPSLAHAGESTYVLISGVRGVWGPPRGEVQPSQAAVLAANEELCVFLPAAERQWLSVGLGSSGPTEGVLATVALESGERTRVARLKPLRNDEEGWLAWSWPEGIAGRQRLSLRAEVGGTTVRLHRVGWAGPAEHPACAAYKLPVADNRRPPVIIVLLDALRADRWGLKRDGRSVTPTLDRLAEQGVLFTHGRCQVPYTRGSLPCIMNGRYPSRPRDVPRDEGPRSLAGLLREHGYATVAVTANGYLQPGTESAEGFDLSLYVHTWLRAHRSPDPPYWGKHLVAPVREMLFQLGDQPFLLFVHLMQPHGPYAPPAPFDTAWAPREAGRLAGLEPFGPTLVPGAVRWTPTPEEIAYLRGRYEGNLAYGDHIVDVLLDLVERCGPRQNPIVAVLSDHGEALLEHTTLGHGASLYEENLRVPICLSGPGLPRGRVIDSPVELVDVAPTVLELVGCSPSEIMEGTSLLSAIANGGQAKPGPFVAACPKEGGGVAGRVACYAPPWKYIHLRGREEQLYNLQDDPGETLNLADKHPETCSVMKQQCAAWAHREIQAMTPSVDSLTEEERQRLEELGYIAR